jgi:orotidine-5'-phosphate decarboxylase
MAPNDRIIFALDVGDIPSARLWVETLRGCVGWFKIGLELFTAAGPQVVGIVKDSGARCFLDLKLHDIPNTVSGAVRAVTRLGVDMTTIHLSGGRAMVEAALEAASREAASLGITRPKILGVSVLTSLGAEDLGETGIPRTPGEQVELLARLAVSCGVDGLVCAASDLGRIRPATPPSLLLVTPGIRPERSVSSDQKRTASPAHAVKEGADLLVVGRPISEAADPLEAVERIASEISSALRP